MSYSIEEINGCTKKLLFTFEGVDLTTQIETELKEKQKNANLKGFRKGKAPINFVKQVYGAQAENDALYRFVITSFFWMFFAIKHLNFFVNSKYYIW